MLVSIAIMQLVPSEGGNIDWLLVKRIEELAQDFLTTQDVRWLGQYRNRHSAVLGQVEWFVELQRAVDDGRGQLGLHDESRKGRLLVEPAGLDAADAIQVVETVECQSKVDVGNGSRGLRLSHRTVEP